MAFLPTSPLIVPFENARRAYYADKTWPLELRRNYTSPTQALLRIPFEEGPSYLFRGGFPLAMNQFLFWTTFGTLYTFCKNKFFFFWVYHDFSYEYCKLVNMISAYFGINPPGFVASVVAFAFGLAAASFFPAIIMGIFSKKMNKEGAIAGMVTGITFTAAYIIYFKFVSPELNAPAHWLFGISPEGIGLVGMIVNFVVAGIVLKLTAETPVEIQEMVESIRNPKGSSAAHAH